MTNVSDSVSFLLFQYAHLKLQNRKNATPEEFDKSNLVLVYPIALLL